jgi:cob(I)alamin adenosyltransferase
VKIYTRTGDGGDTALFGGRRVRKDDTRVEAYGEVDELSAVVGFAIVASEGAADRKVAERLRVVQEDLFAIGAHLATPEGVRGAANHLPPLPIERVAEMEEWIDEADERLPPLRNFILPGGTESAARLHLARAVCRRAERRVLALGASASIDGTIIVYLNRLSDLLFTLARAANANAGQEDIPWQGRQSGQ